MAKKKKYYVIWKGHMPGIYDDWAKAQAQIKGFQGALFKSFPSINDAEKALKVGPKPYLSGGASKAKPSGKTPRSQIVWQSLSVDAACSGNPGPMEYQGVDTKSKDQVFHQAFPMGTNNIGEFLAIVHGLALLQKQNLPHLPIYTDSATAMAWVRKKKVKTNLVNDSRTATLHELIIRGENWLKTNTFTNPILKWDTDSWGEIPADFGRK
ncbi:viroplasmin family protein [Lewinella cohaerens]|uniref:ribonuclease H1 domain-containing protein n=1 Tax=Lewinella cohaerens TaxID=70995 RepID=UPI0003A0BFBB|nr:ribonuclease H family protein [Lewinella cohaerens]